MKKTDNFIFFLVTMFLALAWLFYMFFFSPQISLSEVPQESLTDQVQVAEGEGSSEEKIIDQSPGDFWVSSEFSISKGKKVYAQNCAVCHGPEGKGDGAAGASLNPKPRNLVEGKWTKGGSSKDLFLTLTNGIAGGSMVAFAHLSKEDRWALVHYIRSITQNKVEENLKEVEDFAKSN